MVPNRVADLISRYPSTRQFLVYISIMVTLLFILELF